MNADSALAATINERIRELRGYVRWYNALEPTRRWHWRDLEAGHRKELAGLLRLVRSAHRLAAKAPDPVTVAKAHAEWTSGELVAGFGR